MTRKLGASACELFATVDLARVTAGTWQRLAPFTGPAPRQSRQPGRVHVVAHGEVLGTFSYSLREGSWGRGYATEAANQVVSVAFTTAGLNRLEAMHHPDNPASGRVLVKGFTRVGASDRHNDDGGAIPYELYALEAVDTLAA
ncbi:GNAT family N-acetyltransferase [Streptomyces celluloflavus]|uniref:GNAT family N-acetyltransferase n=1 Tax=Streptomyces celluloflavus TaxID=58344 RepID=A0ABW7RER4_9ACTN